MPPRPYDHFAVLNRVLNWGPSMPSASYGISLTNNFLHGRRAKMRSVPEWIADHDDQSVPKRVRLRIFERHHGICHLSARLIRAGEPWDLDHIVALANGGEHRESNLAPALREKHREKTRADVAEKATLARKRAKHIGIKSNRKKIQNAGFRKAPAQHSATRPI